MTTMQENISPVEKVILKAQADKDSVGKMMDNAQNIRMDAMGKMQQGDVESGRMMFRKYGLISEGIAVLYPKLEKKDQYSIGALTGEFLLDAAYGFMMAQDYGRAFDCVDGASEAFAKDAILNSADPNKSMHDSAYVASECIELGERCEILKSELRDVKYARGEDELGKVISAFEKVLRA